MNLDFGILWIEDSYSEQEEESLRRRAGDAGFIARIHNIPNGDTLQELGREQALFHPFDLVLLDYKLRNVDGDDLAPEVRRLFPSTTILFYSGNDDEDGLRRRIAAKRVEGVYCSHRRRFIERTGELVDQAARALDRLSGMRGLAMRVVAECDSVMRDTVLALDDRHQSCRDKRTDLDTDVTGHLATINSRYVAAMEGDLQGRIDTFAVDSAKLFKHFRRLARVAANHGADFGLDAEQVDQLRSFMTASSQYDREVLQRRNLLGHVQEVRGEDGWVLEGGGGLGVGDFPGIRQSFASHIDAIRAIRALLIPRV